MEWKPLALLSREIKLDQAHAALVRVEDRRPPTRSEAPQSLAIGLYPTVDELKVGRIEWSGPGISFAASDLAGSYRYRGTASGAARQPALGRRQLPRSRQCRCAHAPLPVDATLEGRFLTSVPGGTAQLPLDFTASAARAAGASCRSTQRCRWRQAQRASATHATATAQITPWAQQPVPQAQADFRELDLAALWPKLLPRTSLAGQVRLQPAGTGTWTVSADVANRLAGPWDKGRLPLDRLSAQGEWRLSGQGAGAQPAGAAGWWTTAGPGASGAALPAGPWQAAWITSNPAALHSAMAAVPLSGRADLNGEGSGHRVRRGPEGCGSQGRRTRRQAHDRRARAAGARIAPGQRPRPLGRWAVVLAGPGRSHRRRQRARLARSAARHTRRQRPLDAGSARVAGPRRWPAGARKRPRQRPAGASTVPHRPCAGCSGCPCPRPCADLDARRPWRSASRLAGRLARPGAAGAHRIAVAGTARRGRCRDDERRRRAALDRARCPGHRQRTVERCLAGGCVAGPSSASAAWSWTCRGAAVGVRKRLLCGRARWPGSTLGQRSGAGRRHLDAGAAAPVRTARSRRQLRRRRGRSLVDGAIRPRHRDCGPRGCGPCGPDMGTACDGAPASCDGGRLDRLAAGLDRAAWAGRSWPAPRSRATWCSTPNGMRAWGRRLRLRATAGTQPRRRDGAGGNRAGGLGARARRCARSPAVAGERWRGRHPHAASGTANAGARPMAGSRRDWRAAARPAGTGPRARRSPGPCMRSFRASASGRCWRRRAGACAARWAPTSPLPARGRSRGWRARWQPTTWRCGRWSTASNCRAAGCARGWTASGC